MTSMLQKIRKHSGLMRMLVARNLKIRYKGSALGFFWSLLTPALTILMYAVFARILKFNNGQSHYLEYLVVGTVAWGFTAGCMNDSLFAIAGNANLVKKVYFPRVILPLSTAAANCVNFSLTLAPLLLFLFATGALDLRHCHWLLPAFAAQTALCAGICCLVGTLNVFFRDTQHVVGVGQMAWFFLTPVFYGVSMQLEAFSAAPALKKLVFLNPMTGVLCMYRRGLMGQSLVPDEWTSAVPPCSVWISVAVCVAVLFAGLRAIKAGNKKFGDVL